MTTPDAAARVAKTWGMSLADARATLIMHNGDEKELYNSMLAARTPASAAPTSGSNKSMPEPSAPEPSALSREPLLRPLSASPGHDDLRQYAMARQMGFIPQETRPSQSAHPQAVWDSAAHWRPTVEHQTHNVPQRIPSGLMGSFGEVRGPTLTPSPNIPKSRPATHAVWDSAVHPASAGEPMRQQHPARVRFADEHGATQHQRGDTKSHRKESAAMPRFMSFAATPEPALLEHKTAKEGKQSDRRQVTSGPRQPMASAPDAAPGVCAVAAKGSISRETKEQKAATVGSAVPACQAKTKSRRTQLGLSPYPHYMMGQVMLPLVPFIWDYGCSQFSTIHIKDSSNHAIMAVFGAHNEALAKDLRRLEKQDNVSYYVHVQAPFGETMKDPNPAVYLSPHTWAYMAIGHGTHNPGRGSDSQHPIDRQGGCALHRVDTYTGVFPLYGGIRNRHRMPEMGIDKMLRTEPEIHDSRLSPQTENTFVLLPFNKERFHVFASAVMVQGRIALTIHVLLFDYMERFRNMQYIQKWTDMVTVFGGYSDRLPRILETL